MDYKSIWQQTKDALQTQMTRQTFDGLGLSLSEARALEGDTLTVYTPVPRATEWLNGPTNQIVTRVLTHVAGTPLAVVFVNGSSPQADPTPEAAAVEAVEVSDEAALLAQFDQLKNNWVKHPRYLSLFYQPYLSSFGYFAGSRALGVWQFIRDRIDDKKYANAWTPVWEVGLKELCQLTGLTPHRLNGVWRACPVFAQALEAGQVIECCGRYGQARHDELSCRYWQPGALQLLAEHVLLAIRKTGTSTRNTRLFVQIYQRPFLLTPWQESRLSTEAQTTHRAFLTELNIDLALWSRIKVISLASAWFDRSGLELPSERSAVLSLNRLNKFFLPSDRVYLDVIAPDLDPD